MPKLPIDVHREDRRELLCADGELRVHGREAKADVQVVPKPVHEVVVHVQQVLLQSTLDIAIEIT